MTTTSNTVHHIHDDKKPTIFPSVLNCDGCNHKHIAIALDDYESDFLERLLSMNRDFLNRMIKEAKDEADKRCLQEELEMTDHITDKINWKKK
jgi:hypothetical protein